MFPGWRAWLGTPSEALHPGKKIGYLKIKGYVTPLSTKLHGITTMNNTMALPAGTLVTVPGRYETLNTFLANSLKRVVLHKKLFVPYETKQRKVTILIVFHKK